MFARALAAAAILALGVLPGAARAQYPDKPVRVVIPFPPGGPTDAAVRVIAPAMAQALGQEMFIDNKAGSHGSLGPAFVMKAPPDGHTLLVGNSSPMVAVPVLRKLPRTIPSRISPRSRLWDGRRSCWW